MSSFNPNHSKDFIFQSCSVLNNISTKKIEEIVDLLNATRDNKGRLFILGVGGSAGHASHATNDFRKLCKIESYCPTDNVSELTARVNDEGWETFFVEYLIGSNLNSKDCLLFFSVGGGSKEKNVSVGLINAIDHAVKIGANSISVTGKVDGYIQKKSNINISLSPENLSMITPVSEGLTAVVWHMLVSHPNLQKSNTKW